VITTESKPFVFEHKPALPGQAAVQLFGSDGRGVITTTFRTDERFTTRHQEGSLIITLTGTVADGKAKVNEIQVQDGGSVKKYGRISEVPQQYRDKVKNLADMSEKSSIKIEIKQDKKSGQEDEKPKKRRNPDGDAL
jgi:hypothetical protein